jgi:predicted ester cyclase
MINEQNREIIRQLYTAVIAKSRQASRDKSRPNGFTQYTVSARPSSLKAFKNFFAAVTEAFPDYDLTIDALVEKGDKIMARYTISGTQTGHFMGLTPSYEKLTITGIDIFRLDNGKVIEHWDAAHQISALPLSTQGMTTITNSRNSGRLVAALSANK